MKLVWASAAEGVKLAHEIATLVEEVRALGPLHWGYLPKGEQHQIQEHAAFEVQEVAA